MYSDGTFSARTPGKRYKRSGIKNRRSTPGTPRCSCRRSRNGQYSVSSAKGTYWRSINANSTLGNFRARSWSFSTTSSRSSSGSRRRSISRTTRAANSAAPGYRRWRSGRRTRCGGSSTSNYSKPCAASGWACYTGSSSSTRSAIYNGASWCPYSSGWRTCYRDSSRSSGSAAISSATIGNPNSYSTNGS